MKIVTPNVLLLNHRQIDGFMTKNILTLILFFLFISVSCNKKLGPLNKSDCPIKTNYLDIELWQMDNEYFYHCTSPVLEYHCSRYPSGGYYGCNIAILESENWEETLNDRIKRYSYENKTVDGVVVLEDASEDFLYDSLPDLKLLKLINITTVPEQIRRFKNLEVLHLDSKKLINIPDWIDEFEDLEVLSIYGGDSLKKIPKSIQNLKKLKQIYLVNIPNLSDFELDYSNFSLLEKLELKGNTKEYLNESITHCANLKYLTTSTFHQFINKLSNLKMLALFSVSEEKHIEELSTNKSIEELFIQNYSCSTFNKSLFQIKSLRNIGIEFGYHSLDVPKIEHKNLQYLSLIGHGLKSFPKLSTPNLRYLNFHSFNENANIIISKSLLKMEFLEFVYLKGTGIKKLEFDKEKTRFRFHEYCEHI